MTYAQVSQSIFSSAVSTLEIIDRKARKDTARLIDLSYSVYIKLSSPEAKRRYDIAREVVGRLAEIAWLVVLAIGNDLQRIAEENVAACLPEEQPTEPMPIDDSLCVADVVESNQEFGETHEPVATVEPQPESSNDTVEQADPTPARGRSSAAAPVRRGNAKTAKGKARKTTSTTPSKDTGILKAS